jgi:oligoribonuclease NrnB/cAMP/cGMP phosphodiesterase (DHH superfamily)
MAEIYTELKDEYNYEGKVLNRNEIDIVIYHHNCVDGFMSASIAKKYLDENISNSKSVQYIPFQYSWNTYYLLQKIKGKNVLITDFSFDYDIVKKMIETTKSLLILDHHKTAQKKLEKIDSKYLVFDMKHSGAFITWTYFYGFQNIPESVMLVEDRDLWNKKLENTEEFHSYVEQYIGNFEIFINSFEDKYLNEIIKSGKIILDTNQKHITNLAKNRNIYFTEINNKYYFIGSINSQLFKSDLGNKIILNTPELNLSITYSHNIDDKETYMSLRSTDNNSSCLEIAEHYGGGGHRNACGVKLPNINNTLGNVIGNYDIYKIMDNIFYHFYTSANIIYLNSPLLQTEFAKYIMTNRSDELHINGYYFLIRKFKLEEIFKFDAVVVYNYDGEFYTGKSIMNKKTYSRLKDKEEITYNSKNGIIDIKSKDLFFLFQ